MRTKSQERKLAELIARQDGIKVKSAMRRIQRAVKSERPIRPPKTISVYAARKFRAVVQQKKTERFVKRPAVRQPAPAATRRVNFNFPDKFLLTVTGRFELGSGKKKKDVRDRSVRVEIDAKQANKFFNAKDSFQAARILQNFAPYVGSVERLDSIEFDGRNYSESFFENNS